MSLNQLCSNKPNPWATLRCQSMVVDGGDNRLPGSGNINVRVDSTAITDSVSTDTGKFSYTKDRIGNYYFEFWMSNTAFNNAVNSSVITFPVPANIPASGLLCSKAITNLDTDRVILDVVADFTVAGTLTVTIIGDKNIGDGANNLSFESNALFYLIV